MHDLDGWPPVRSSPDGSRRTVLRSPGAMAYALTVRSAAAAGRLAGERDRLLWLGRHGLPVPRVLDWLETATGSPEADGDRTGPLAALVVSGLPGVAAHAVAPALLPAATDAVREAMGRLHALDVGLCPFDAGPTVEALAALPAPLAAAVRTAPSDDVVVTHGSLHPRHVLVHPTTGTLSGILGVGALGAADRHRDLAVLRLPGPTSVDLTAHPATRDADPRRLAAYAELARRP